MNKYLVIGALLFGVITGGFFCTVPAHAQEPMQYQGSALERQLNAFGGKQGASLGNPEDPRVVVARLIKAVLGVVGVIVFALTVYGGFLVLMSRGEEDKIARGKKIIVYSVSGVAVILGAYSIALFIYIGMYQSWQNPMTVDTDTFYIRPNDVDLYNTDPLEGNTTPFNFF